MLLLHLWLYAYQGIMKENNGNIWQGLDMIVDCGQCFEMDGVRNNEYWVAL